LIGQYCLFLINFHLCSQKGQNNCLLLPKRRLTLSA
jgi:hypothetical protein